MWSHCIVCSGDLGSNEEVEAFPIGRRLVFDPAKGRLWAVCPRCRRWNLTPVEERWEAVESLERLWRDATARVAGESLSLARLRSGMWVVRVGSEPHEAELAAWRWGRRSRFGGLRPGLVGALAVVGTGAVALALPPAAILPALGYGAWLGSYALMARSLEGTTTVDKAGDVDSLKRREFLNSGMAPSEDDLGWSIHLERILIRTRKRPFLNVPGLPLVTEQDGLAERHRIEFRGADAVRIARRAFPLLNARHSSEATVTHALELVRTNGGPEAYLRVAAGMKPKWVKFRHYPVPLRLSLEMTLFQEEERRALQGELKHLEEAWKEAEELAAISDGLLPPRGWEQFRRRARGVLRAS